MSRDTVIAPRGLQTAPNKHGMPRGALSKALNVCMREKNVISSLPDVRSFRADVSSSGHTLRALHPGASNVLALTGNGSTWLLRWVASGSSTAITAPITIASGTFSAGKARVAILRDRWLLTNDVSEPWLFDAEADTTPRRAGLPPPQIAPTNPTATNAQAVSTGKTVAYRALIRRVHSDGYETISAPSEPFYFTNSIGSTYNPIIHVDFPAVTGDDPVIAGDIVEIYRSKSVDAGFSPGDTLYLAVSFTLTATEISNTVVNVTDNALESSLAVELYTNPNQDKIAGAKMPPPLAAGVAIFKGRAFYIASRIRCLKRLKIPGPTGALSSATERATGIGTRAVTGDVTNLSSDIANISDTTGLAIGQIIAISGNNLNGGTIAAIVGSTVTMSTVSDATTVGAAMSFNDVISIDGGSSVSLSSTVEGNFNAASSGARFVYEGGAPAHVYTAPGTKTLTWPSSFAIEKLVTSSSDMTLRASNGANYYPELPDMNETAVNVSADPRGNRYCSSLDQQPEAVSPEHYGFVGAGTIYRMIPTRDALYFFCSDGLHRLSGDEFPWQVDPVDPTLILSARNAVDVLGDTIWAYTNRGLVSITNDQVKEVSTEALGDASTLPGAAYSDTWDTFLTCDELHREVWLTFRSGGNSVSYVFNTLTQCFTTVDDDEWSCSTYSRALQSLVVGAVSSNPDVLYFETDTSGTRMPGAELRFQPFTMGEPFSLKEFVDVDYLFEGASTALTLVPSFDGTNYAAVTVAGNVIEAHGVAPVPRNAPAVARRLAPGFTLSAGGTAQRWSFRGISVAWQPAAESADR